MIQEIILKSINLFTHAELMPEKLVTPITEIISEGYYRNYNNQYTAEKQFIHLHDLHSLSTNTKRIASHTKHMLIPFL